MEEEEKVGERYGARLLCGHIAPHCVEEPSVGGSSFLSCDRMASPLAHGDCPSCPDAPGVTSVIVI